ncbi:MAG: CehA/McbA family metallohydrolase [Candidatus Latescibacteria bacterium]|nr:CehA/McbA family metallohydrolase [Candidatus Latescibacterota bacterium]
MLFRKWPEIICDAPSRVDPGRPIPVFIIIKDAHLYPIQLEKVAIHLRYEQGFERIAQFPYGEETISEPIWWDSINIMPEFPGVMNIMVSIIVRKGRKRVQVNIDNYRGTTHSPLKVHAAASYLPKASNWYRGDIHCHSYYTSDQIEFGAPLEVMSFAAFCMGLDWIAVTDHSYDLDDFNNDYCKEDPLLAKWHMMRNKAKFLSPATIVIPGEEVTCRTISGHNCHLLSLDSEKFIKGSGDSGEKGLKTKTEKSVGEAVRECIEWNGLACAAHPLEDIPFLERVILARGKWTNTDMEYPGLSALQVYNGIKDRGFRIGKEAWIRLLLKGKRIYAFGGSDAHGDMNRRRHIMMPLMSMGEDDSHTLGSVCTCVKANSRNKEDIVEGLKKGRALVSDGPFIDLSIAQNSFIAFPGSEISGLPCKIKADIFSSSEFGTLKNACILAGKKGDPDEKELVFLNDNFSDYKRSLERNLSLSEFSYIRAECTTVSGKNCFTNPIWIVNNSR